MAINKYNASNAYNKDYDGKCLTCVNLNPNNHYNGKAVCSRPFGVSANTSLDDSCNKYYNNKKSHKDLKSDLERIDPRGRYFVSTAVLLTLIKNGAINEEEGKMYNYHMKSFLDNVVRVSPEYTQFLEEYETRGEVVAGLLNLDDKKDDISFALLEGFIKPTVNAIIKEEYERAISVYHTMFQYLNERLVEKKYDFPPVEKKKEKPKTRGLFIRPKHQQIPRIK